MRTKRVSWGRAVGAFGGSAIAVLSMASCGGDALFCGSGQCGWNDEEWGEVSALAELPEQPPADPSNKFVGNAGAVALGQKFFFDARFSGTATMVDQLKRPVPYARAAKGSPVSVSCASCHDPNRAGIDTTSIPGHVSIGAGWFDVNAQSTMNAAFYELEFWNGRADSLWAQAMAASEGGVAMNGSRMAIVWAIADLYRGDYDAVFGEYPLPMSGRSDDVKGMLDSASSPAGQCATSGGACPAGCRAVTDANGAASGCWPRFPLAGKPGSKAGCQPGDSAEPFGDAWDCMDADDQAAVNRAWVNWGKAIEAYEYKLVSRNAEFDKWVREGADSTRISASARRGARLFVGKAACNDCHRSALLSDNSFHNVGVPQTGPSVPTEADCPAGGVCDCVEIPASTGSDGTAIPAKDSKNCLPWGAYDGLKKLRKSTFRRDSVWSDDQNDTSRKRWIDMPAEAMARGAWRTPSLRDVALSAPYMHDGAFKTLEEVVWHYNRGGDPSAVGAATPEIRPLYLSDAEQADLVEFLKTLTGESLPADWRTPPVLP